MKGRVRVLGSTTLDGNAGTRPIACLSIMAALAATFLAFGCASTPPPRSAYDFRVVWAGETGTSRYWTAQAKSEINDNIRRGIVLPAVTEVSCTPYTNYWVVVLVHAPARQWVSFDRTWEHSHLEKALGRPHTTDNLVLRKDVDGVFPVRFFGWRLTRRERVDGDIRFMIHEGERVHVTHTFKVRGCPADQRDD